MERKWKKINNGVFFGVASGLAYALGVQTWIIRFIWAATVVFAGFGILPYVLLAIFMPSWEQDPEDYEKICH